jgi:hypothetical protein
MSDRYNLYNLEALFKEYLVAGNQKPVSIKNYLSDIRHFFGWFMFYIKSNPVENDSRIVSKNEKDEQESLSLQYITVNVIYEYKSYLSENNIPNKTINRRLSTVRKFCSFCISQGWLKENPAKEINNVGGVGEIGTLLKEFKKDLLKENLEQKSVNNYLDDVQEFLGLEKASN